jgi:pyridoxine 4-dehydrogenase
LEIYPNSDLYHGSYAISARCDNAFLIISNLLKGAWAWGDALFWGYNPKQDNDLKEVFNYAVSKNLAFFDTAELYGLGRSEYLLGKFRKEAGADGGKVQIATKFAALPFRTTSNDVVKACKDSLRRLNPDGKNEPIDLYQIHFPNAWSNEEYWAPTYARAKVSRLT